MSIVNTKFTEITVENNRIKVLVIGDDGLNDNGGVFALRVYKYQRYTRNKQIQIFCDFYSGDDGQWKKVLTFDFHWLVQIAQCFLIAIDLKDKLLEE